MKSEPRPLIFDIGRPAERAVSAACKVGSMTPATLAATFVLKFENVFERAVEAVGPEMCSAERVDQLRGDADAVAGLVSTRLPAFSLFLPGSCPNYRDRRSFY